HIYQIDCSSLLYSSPTLFDHETSPPALYPLSLHDALPIFDGCAHDGSCRGFRGGLQRPPRTAFRNLLLRGIRVVAGISRAWPGRSEEHTSELQSRENLVCRLLLEKKKKERYKH